MLSTRHRTKTSAESSISTQHSLKQPHGQMRFRKMSEWFSFRTVSKTSTCVSLSIMESHLQRNELVSRLRLSCCPSITNATLYFTVCAMQAGLIEEWQDSMDTLSAGEEKPAFDSGGIQRRDVWQIISFPALLSHMHCHCKKIYVSNFTPHRGNELQEKKNERRTLTEASSGARLHALTCGSTASLHLPSHAEAPGQNCEKWKPPNRFCNIDSYTLTHPFLRNKANCLID